MKKLFYLAIIAGFIVTSCAKPEPNEEPTYSFEIGAEKGTDDTDETRVEMVDGLMHWSVGDKIGMYVTADRATYSRPQDIYVNNFAMTGLHSEPTRATTFKGLLMKSDISKLNPNSTYRHFSYYPYGSMELYSTATYNTSGIIMEQTIPSSFSVRPNEFPTDAVYMFAEEEGMNSPMTWLEGNEQKWSEKRTLTYKHTMAYLRVKINSYNGSYPLTKINIQYTTYRPGLSNIQHSPISRGKAQLYTNYKQGNNYYITYNLSQAMYNFIEIDTDWQPINAGDYVYIPIPLVGPMYPLIEYRDGGYNRIMFSFHARTGSNTYWHFTSRSPQIAPVTGTPMLLEPGKIYDIAFNL